MDSLEGCSEGLVRDTIKNKVEGLLCSDSVNFPNIYLSDVNMEGQKVTVILTSEISAKKNNLKEVASLMKERLENNTEKAVKVEFSPDSFIKENAL
ncbi:MAG: hypothetical protein PHS16_00680 [Candidatus Colwellbacteria bacterium]|jgi:hypothetical protein|nr:hypothetical protein [Candidatus Colwellbacteria bacterium]MCK9497517.1 hypothetical protein [Candidatus Colwellbacteria bacterium]MDD3752445.1 hypothetical protein [Candidatus Colwellbacteria bacterium]MDD4818685.1 hypothetical protein [Candidatus Colwellbacteria bacterium]